MNLQEVCTGLSGTRAGLSAERKKLVQTLQGGAVKRKSSLDTGFSGRRFRPRRGCGRLMAEGVGFEPTRAVQTPLIFETSALNHSAIPPNALNMLPKSAPQGNTRVAGAGGSHP